MRKLRILLLSGYDAASHRYWRDLLCTRLTEFDWKVVALPDRHFFWRVRGNALTFAHSHTEQLAGPFDLLIATSMVDICNLRGFLPHLASVPTLVYFHENQFVYPINPASDSSSNNVVNAQLTSIYSALCVDHILFNSQYNQRTFNVGAGRLLKKMPDGIESGLIDTVIERSQVLPVPIVRDISSLEYSGTAGRETQGIKPLEIVWNHRWEYDKQPEVFFRALLKLLDSGVDFRIHVMGQSFREVPDCFGHAKVSLKEKIVTWGHQPTTTYYKILKRADIVVSTALHDFQGLSLLEAIHRGCVPVAPERVAYPEYIPAALMYSTQHDEADNLFRMLLSLFENPLPPAPDVSQYLEVNLLEQYAMLFRRLTRKQDGSPP